LQYLGWHIATLLCGARSASVYLWIRRLGGKQVNRTLRPGPELERVREGVANYQKMQRLLAKLLEEEESRVLAGGRAMVGGNKKNFKRRSKKR
jgi:hypothetical protein